MLIQQFVNGLTLGAVYTLIALSYSLVMGILGVLNLAIAELFMLGGYFGFAFCILGKRSLAFPRFHRGTLHRFICGFALGPCAREGEQDLLAEIPTFL